MSVPIFQIMKLKVRELSPFAQEEMTEQAGNEGPSLHGAVPPPRGCFRSCFLHLQPHHAQCTERNPDCRTADCHLLVSEYTWQWSCLREAHGECTPYADVTSSMKSPLMV